MHPRATAKDNLHVLKEPIIEVSLVDAYTPECAHLYTNENLRNIHKNRFRPF